MEHILKSMFSNGLILIIPILVWNFIFTDKLPAAYKAKINNSRLLVFFSAGENIFRGIIFLLPLFIKISISTKTWRYCFVIFLLGTLLYFFSLLPLIYALKVAWSRSYLGLLAPAYIPLIWLIGLSLLFDTYYFGMPYSKWHYIIPSILFVIFHCAHTLMKIKKSELIL